MMPTLFERFDDPYIYGPLSNNDVQEILVNHRMVELGDGWYVGVPVQIEKWKHVEIVRPLPPPPSEPVAEETAEIPANSK
jgi:hypothetical protein